jgi:hypothetical protein
VSVAGKIGGASGVNVEIGDLLLCLTDGTASGNQAAVGAQWSIAQTNVDGAVIGPASAVDATPIVFDGATGKLIKNITFASFKSSLAIVAGDLSDFAATVRATVLTGLSLASSTVISATDTILQALGQLQAQVTLRALAARALTAGTGLTGGGDLTADRSFAIDKATDANVRAAAADKVVTSDRIETASAFVALTINTTPTPDEVTTNGTILDWDAFINATLTHTANMTLINPSNGQPGTWRSIAFTQHSSPVTITLGSQYKTVGAAGLVVSTGSGAKDMINILCVTTTEFWLFHSKAMS